MRGIELLDQMELVDPAYVEAADTMPKKTNRFRWNAVAACFAAVLLIGGMMLGAELTDSASTRPHDVPSAVIDWDMYAVWVDQEGNVVPGQEPLEFCVQCEVYANGDDTSGTELEYVFTFPEEFRYELKMPDSGRDFAIAPRTTGYPYYISYGYLYDFKMAGYVFGFWAFSLEKEWMILELDHSGGSDKDPGAYLLAFRNPNADPMEILTYFQGFLDSYSPTGPHIVPPGFYDHLDTHPNRAEE